MNRKEDTVFCYYAHNSVWTCELGYGADTMFHRTYSLFVFYFIFLGLVVMGRHKCEVIACLSSQTQCELIAIFCTEFMANKFD